MAIYCDESGYTGNDLLTNEQPYFSYVGVNIEPQQAEEYIKYFKEKFRINSEEVKASQLLKRPNGRDAISDLLNEFLQYSKIIFINKKFSLSAKFFEYIFGPILGKISKLLSSKKFHLFIVNAVYSLYTSKPQAESRYLLDDFDAMMRQKNKNYKVLFKKNDSNDLLLKKICEFSYYNKDKIIKEYNNLGTEKKWILDDSLGAVYGILAHWTEEIGDLEVFCDISKPLIYSKDALAEFVGRKDQEWQYVEERYVPLLAHLKKEISFVNSKDYPGIQIADVIASSVCYSFKNNKRCHHALKWKSEIKKYVIGALFPDSRYYVKKNLERMLNFIILDELVYRSENKKKIDEGMYKFINDSEKILSEELKNAKI